MDEYARAFCRCPAQIFILSAKNFHVLFFVIKNLLNFLPCYHFLCKSVDRCQIFLLPVKIRFAPLPVPFDKPEHDQKEYDHDKSHPHIQHKKHNYSAGQSQRALDHHRKAVVERLLYRIYVVGKPAHQFSVSIGVKIFQRQSLHMGERVPPDIPRHLLGCLYHQPVISECRQRSAQIHDAHTRQRKNQPLDISRKNKIIDHRFEKISSRNTDTGADQDKDSDHKEQPSVIPHIVKKLPECLCRILRALISCISCHYRSAPSFWDS